jgi:hypothetical protein
LGSGVVVAAATGAWALTRDPTAARAPWAAAGQILDGDPRTRWLSWAILAPNPHNRQPWIVDLRIPDEITLLVDLNRRLPDTDPFDRQITIGLGAFLELARMAAAEEGVALDVAAFPDGADTASLDLRPIARLKVMTKAAAPDPLFQHGSLRRTNRAAFDVSRAVSQSDLEAIAAEAIPLRAGFTADTTEVARLRDIAWRAMVIEMNTPAAAIESVDLTRIGRAEIEANPDGISLSGPMMEGLALAGLLSRDGMAQFGSAGHQAMMDAQKPQFDTAMAFLWIATEGNDRIAQVAAGRAYLRANLAATARGVAMQPFSQALQEYPEMAPSYAELANALAPRASDRVQMFARLGFAEPPAQSPRWPLATRILKA